MKLRELLGKKGHDVVQISPSETVARAISLLVSHDIGSVVVTRDGEILGILTERDILRIAARDPGELGSRAVEEAMTSDLIVAVPDDDLHYVMEIMTKNRVRHLPVVVDGRLEGIVSIGDVVNACRRDVEAENRYLRDYVHGVVR